MPWVDIENSRRPTNVAIFTPETESRDRSSCAEGRYGPKGTLVRGNMAALVLSGDGKRVDRQKTYSIFGIADLSRYGVGAGAEYPWEFGIFVYRGITYYDNFLHPREDDLGVWLYRNGRRQEVCAYHVKGLGDPQ